jgi:AAA ATPase domain
MSRLLFQPQARSRRPKWFDDFADLSRLDTNHVIEIDDEKCGDIIRHVNDLLKKGGDEFLSHIFAFSGFRNTRVQIESGAFEPFKVQFSMVGGILKGDSERDQVSVNFSDGSGVTFVDIGYPLTIFKEHPLFFIDTMFESIVYIALLGKNSSFGDITYVPAARTGLILALGALISEGLRAEENPSRELPQPLRSFLRHMARPQHASRSRSIGEIASWLGENVAHGSIESNRSPGMAAFKYKPHGTEIEIPLHATSSMITELTPFLISLNTDLRLRRFILEEPEAHLHLEAQREMARAIARMVSEGAQVTLTTHSDTFLQQINNLMSLHDHPKRSKLMKTLGYEKTDLIDPAKVEAYEFQPSSGGTEVRRLKRASEGFIVGSLNETLLALAKETLLLREGLND